MRTRGCANRRSPFMRMSPADGLRKQAFVRRPRDYMQRLKRINHATANARLILCAIFRNSGDGTTTLVSPRTLSPFLLLSFPPLPPHAFFESVPVSPLHRLPALVTLPLRQTVTSEVIAGPGKASLVGN